MNLQAAFSILIHRSNHISAASGKFKHKQFISMASQNRPRRNFEEWMIIQSQELSEIVQALNLNSENDTNFTQRIQKSIKLFQDYAERRSQIAQSDFSAYFPPLWCSAIEHSLIWISGCRPSKYIRLIYALSGSEIEPHLREFLDGPITVEEIGGISHEQLVLLDNLHRKTVRAEWKLTTQMAILQERVVDDPLVKIVKRLSKVGEMNDAVEKELDRHERAVVGILEEADKLRLSTLKELLEILTPKQMVDFLAASKKQHLCLHAWGKERGRKYANEVSNSSQNA